MTATSQLRSSVASLATAVALASSGCAFAVVHTPPLQVRDLVTGETHFVIYPAYVLVHDEESVWDAHQIKDNVAGLFEGEIVGWIDGALDAGTPGPDRRPVASGVETLKNGYAQLPDIAPVRIVGGFFGAFGIEKCTVLGGVRIAGAPGDPISYFAVTRVIYLSDWVQETLGEANTGLGHFVPWPGAFVPASVTAPINGAVDWAQSGAITGYMYVYREINIGTDDILFAWEWAWGAAVSLFVDHGEPVNQSPSQAGPAKP